MADLSDFCIDPTCSKCHPEYVDPDRWADRNFLSKLRRAISELPKNHKLAVSCFNKQEQEWLEKQLNEKELACLS